MEKWLNLHFKAWYLEKKVKKLVKEDLKELIIMEDLKEKKNPIHTMFSLEKNNKIKNIK